MNERKTFRDRIKSLEVEEREKLIRKICRDCNVVSATVSSWIYGMRIPKERTQLKLAKLLGSTPGELFPPELYKKQNI